MMYLVYTSSKGNGRKLQDDSIPMKVETMAAIIIKKL